MEANLASARFNKEIWTNLTAEFPDWRDFEDADLRRKFKEITVLGSAALPEQQLQEVLFDAALLKHSLHCFASINWCQSSASFMLEE